MTVVMRMKHALTGGRSRPEPGETSHTNATVDPAVITFHPELLVRWDDEAQYGAMVPQPECERPGHLAQRPVLRRSARLAN